MEPVKSLWIGELSEMEKLTMRSYLKHGHPFHLYCYYKPRGVPDGVEVLDADTIIPAKEVFKVRDGYSTFSDFFRWKLILDKGGWWTDLDAVCLRPFDFEDDYVFFGGNGPVGSDDCISSGIFKAPAGSDVLQWAWLQCQMMNPATMLWGAAGPPLFTEAVHMFHLQKRIQSGRKIFPIFYTYAPECFTKEGLQTGFPSDTYSVHLFNEMWRLAGADKNVIYPPSSLYELLKAQ